MGFTRDGACPNGVHGLRSSAGKLAGAVFQQHVVAKAHCIIDRYAWRFPVTCCEKCADAQDRP